jgi:hypothetical protein
MISAFLIRHTTASWIPLWARETWLDSLVREARGVVNACIQ